VKSKGKPQRGIREPQGKTPSTVRQTHQTAAPETAQGVSAEAPKSTQTHLKAVRRFKDQLSDYQFLAGLFDLYLENDPEKRNALLLEFAERYLLDMFANSPFVQLIDGKLPDTSDAGFGCIHIVDEAKEVLENPDNIYYQSTPRLSAPQTLRLKHYPVHIALSPLATKREVMDYIAKTWPWIRLLLDSYRKMPPRIRERPKATRDQFIWENRNLHRNQLAEMVNTKFPGESQTYSTIQAILQRLKVRYREWPHFD